MGAYVSVRFHGRLLKGWVLGPTDDLPKRTLRVSRVLSTVPLFGPQDLALYRWMNERYLLPLATVIGRAHPPRVASEEGADVAPPAEVPVGTPPAVLHGYDGGDALLRTLRGGTGAYVVRPLPDHETGACVEAVYACMAGGRDAIVVVPEADPLPETARAVAEAFGDAALLLVGGDRRKRYRAWLDARGGRYRVVVGTRLAAFAPLPNLGLVWVHREAHPGHREERAPRHHVRDAALARARIGGGVAVLAGLCPSGEAALLVDDGAAALVRAPRDVERRAAPLVETVRPEREDLTPRLATALRSAEGAVLLISRRGEGTARVCKRCGEPVRCAACAGPVVLREGSPVCAVCGTAASCQRCGATDFGIDRGGTERVQTWAAKLTGRPVRRVEEGARARPPGPGETLVGTAAAVKDFGPRRVGLVAVLDPDPALRRPGITAAEQALATWMEAAVWAGPKGAGGRVLLQTREPAAPAIQALVRWDPWHLHRHERTRRAEAGFPPGHPVFRVVGKPGLEEAIEALRPAHALSSSFGEEAVSLVTLQPDAVSGFRDWVLGAIEDGLVDRVEAEPQL